MTIACCAAILCLSVSRTCFTAVIIDRTPGWHLLVGSQCQTPVMNTCTLSTNACSNRYPACLSHELRGTQQIVAALYDARASAGCCDRPGAEIWRHHCTALQQLWWQLQPTHLFHMRLRIVIRPAISQNGTASCCTEQSVQIAILVSDGSFRDPVMLVSKGI